MAPRAELLRLACDGDGRVRADPGRRAGGRGLNVHRSPSCLRRALEPGRLARAFRKRPPFDLSALEGLFGADATPVL